MRYEKTEQLTEKEFRRLTGVKRRTFAKMADILKIAEAAKRRKGGHNMLRNADECARASQTYPTVKQRAQPFKRYAV